MVNPGFLPRHARSLLIVVSLLLTSHSPAFAAPPATDDAVNTLLADKGLVERITERASQAGQQASQTTSELVVAAMGLLGVPYRRGGTDAKTGFDCSGFVRAMYEDVVGRVLPRRAVDQAGATQKIDKEDLRPGDLVFFNTLRRAYSHVGIYVGDNKFIHSPRPGAFVRVESMQINYWKSRFDGARRVEAATTASAP